MQLPDEAPAPSHWLVYFGSDDLDGAAQRIDSAGGGVMVPRTAVPGGEILVAQDPQGAVFGLVRRAVRRLMGRREAYAPGSFCWADVGAADREAAKTFFAELFGWAHEDQTGSRGNVYTFLSKDGAVVAGLREGPPFWLSYVSVEDLDATLAQAREAGAALQDEPYEVAPAGRMAVLDDPQGAAFGLWQAYDFPGAGLVNDVGAMVWQHLATNDVDAAKDWYSGLFGWTWEELEGAPGWCECPRP